MELQVLDDNHIMYAKLREDQYHGSAYGIKAPPGLSPPCRQWNTQEVIVKGSNVTVVLNGYTILETDLSKDAPEDSPARTMKKGHFTGHFDQVRFKNIGSKSSTRAKKQLPASSKVLVHAFLRIVNSRNFGARRCLLQPGLYACCTSTRRSLAWATIFQSPCGTHVAD